MMIKEETEQSYNEKFNVDETNTTQTIINSVLNNTSVDFELFLNSKKYSHKLSDLCIAARIAAKNNKSRVLEILIYYDGRVVNTHKRSWGFHPPIVEATLKMNDECIDILLKSGAHLAHKEFNSMRPHKLARLKVGLFNLTTSAKVLPVYILQDIKLLQKPHYIFGQN